MHVSMVRSVTEKLTTTDLESNDWNHRKRLEERFERKDGASSPFENSLNCSADLKGNCTTPSSCEFGTKCVWMQHQIDEQSSQKSMLKFRKAEWVKFSVNAEYVWQLVRNSSGWRAVEVYMETMEEHIVLRPIKRAKIHESHTVTEKDPSLGKSDSTEPRDVDDVPKFAMRQQREDVSAKYKEAQRAEMLFLWCFSASYWENFSDFGSSLHKEIHIMILNVLIWPLLRSEDKVQN